MSRRKVTREELELWRQVTDRTEPLKPEPRPAPLPEPQFVPRPETTIPELRIRKTGSRSTVTYDLAEQLTSRLAMAPVNMDRKAYRRMKRGKLLPEGRLDLHGMTLDRAHAELNRFILSAVASGKRLVLVITGKGRDTDDGGPIPAPRGRLRHQVPHWLTIPPLAAHVMQFTPAHVSHGGEGAYYVYLRRAR